MTDLQATKSRTASRVNVRCRFTLEPETRVDLGKSGTEIEIGASFSLNLSANFVALSGESGLLFDCGLPGFDDGV